MKEENEFEINKYNLLITQIMCVYINPIGMQKDIPISIYVIPNNAGSKVKTKFISKRYKSSMSPYNQRWGPSS